MFSVIFGLSMDYEVLLLSRIQEAYRRTGDNTASVAEGLAKTAGVITGAALIMVTRVRGLRPGRGHHDQEHRRRHGHRGRASTRRSSGSSSSRPRCGSWAAGTGGRPASLGRLADRLGFSHVEDEEPAAPPAPPRSDTGLTGA